MVQQTLKHFLIHLSQEEIVQTGHTDHVGQAGRIGQTEETKYIVYFY